MGSSKPFHHWLRHRLAQRLAALLRAGIGTLLMIAVARQIVAADAAGGGTITVPKLESLEPPAAPATPIPEDRAAPLPRTVTICVDHGARRCWTEAGTTTCAGGGTSAGVVFRVLATDEQHSRPGAALTECWTQVSK